MSATLLPEFSLTCTTRRRACVLDAALALSIYGLPIAKQLGALLELWIARDFWQMLENSGSFRTSHPEQTLFTSRALREWERLRQHVDSQSRPVNVLADVLGESSLPGGTDPDLIWRWERLAQSLDQQLEAQGLAIDGPVIATRDLVALAVARSASILTLRSPTEPEAGPLLCRALERWGVPCLAVSPSDELVGIEASALRQLFVQAGLASLLWSGMEICILHLFVPAAATLCPTPAFLGYDYSLDEPCGRDGTVSVADNLWEQAQAFWYPLSQRA